MLLRIIILVVLAFSFACCLWRLGGRSRPLRLIVVWVGLTLFSEISAFYLAAVYRNNLAVFHIFAPLLFLNTVMYFTSISPVIKNNRIGLSLGIIGLSASVINSIYLQPIHTFNSNFLLFGGLCVCTMGFIVLAEYAKNFDSPSPAHNPHFWITVILLFQQVGAYFIYILIRFLELNHANPGNITTAYYMLWMVGVISYFSIGIVFVCFPVKKTIYE
jgi:hypothetical protein